MTPLRDQLDQIARLEFIAKCLPPELEGEASEILSIAESLRELAEDGMRLIWFLSRRDSTDGIVKMMLRQIEGDYPSMDEWRTAIDAARAKEKE